MKSMKVKEMNPKSLDDMTKRKWGKNRGCVVDRVWGE